MLGMRRDSIVGEIPWWHWLHRRAPSHLQQLAFACNVGGMVADFPCSPHIIFEAGGNASQSSIMVQEKCWMARMVVDAMARSHVSDMGD